MTWPRPTEVAVLSVNGQNYTDWKTVMVRYAKGEPYGTCRFTCSEDQPIAKNWPVMRIRPGYEATVMLAGQLAFTGTIFERQVYYDKLRHHVELIGVSRSQLLTTASVSSPTMEWKKVTLEKFIRDVIQPADVPFKVIGGQLPKIIFPRINIAHGTTKWEAIERQARVLGINFTSDPSGALVAIAGPTGGTDSVTEGKDILIGREIVFNLSLSRNGALSQKTGDNEQRGPWSAHRPYSAEDENLVKNATAFAITGNLPIQTTISEVPPWTNQILAGRVSTERMWNQSDEVTVFITVNGWLKPSGGLWGPIEQTVIVNSPMLIMENEPLKLKSMVFTQDNETGTRTTLELCNEMKLQGARALD